MERTISVLTIIQYQDDHSSDNSIPKKLSDHFPGYNAYVDDMSIVKMFLGWDGLLSIPLSGDNKPVLNMVKRIEFA